MSKAEMMTKRMQYYARIANASLDVLTEYAIDVRCGVVDKLTAVEHMQDVLNNLQASVDEIKASIHELEDE